MPDQFAKDASARVVLLARPGKAADNLAEALRQAGAELVLTADPTTTDEVTVRAHDPQVVLVALEPSIEHALDRLDGLLIDPALTVIYDEADLAAHRAGWEAARWVRHLLAKIRHDDNVLPPGTESDHQWQPSPGQIPKPAAAYADVDLAQFTREAVASADSVPSDGMQSEPGQAARDVFAEDLLPVDAAVPDTAAPLSVAPAPPPAASGIESFELESFEIAAFDAAPASHARPEFEDLDFAAPATDRRPGEGDGISLEGMSLESMSLESMQLESMQLESMQLESMSLDSLTFEGAGSDINEIDSVQLESTAIETVLFDDSALHRLPGEPAVSSVTPMTLDDDAFFLDALAASDAAPLDGGVQPMDLGGRFDTTLDFEADTDFESATASGVAAMPAGVPRTPETVLSFDELIAQSIAQAQSAAQSEQSLSVADGQADSSPGSLLGDLSLAPVDDAPALVRTPAAAPRTHDLSALEARISSLSLVDLDEDLSAQSGAAGSRGDVTGVVLVEAGLGGPDPARQLLASIPAEFPAVVLVRLHLQGGRYDRLVAQMERASALPVALAQAGGGAHPGTIYFLPDGIGLTARGEGLEFTADGAPAADMFDALPTGHSAVVFLSGSDPQLVDTAMAASGRGALVVAQSAEDCYDGTACAELRKRGAASGLPPELAARLASRWPS